MVVVVTSLCLLLGIFRICHDRGQLIFFYQKKNKHFRGSGPGSPGPEEPLLLSGSLRCSVSRRGSRRLGPQGTGERVRGFTFSAGRSHPRPLPCFPRNSSGWTWGPQRTEQKASRPRYSRREPLTGSRSVPVHRARVGTWGSGGVLREAAEARGWRAVDGVTANGLGTGDGRERISFCPDSATLPGTWSG